MRAAHFPIIFCFWSLHLFSSSFPSFPQVQPLPSRLARFFYIHLFTLQRLRTSWSVTLCGCGSTQHPFAAARATAPENQMAMKPDWNCSTLGVLVEYLLRQKGQPGVFLYSDALSRSSVSVVRLQLEIILLQIANAWGDGWRSPWCGLCWQTRRGQTNWIPQSRISDSCEQLA